MKLVIISDTHNKHNQITLPEGDVLIHCGDATSLGRRHECEKFMDWFSKQPFEHKIFIAGNHDWGFDHDEESRSEFMNDRNFFFREPTGLYLELEKYAKSKGLIYLNETSVEIGGLKFFGTPRSKYFHGWAFNGDPYAGHDWSNIPDDTDVLITHGPPYGILDVTYYDKKSVGDILLKERIAELKKLKACLFGHIHEQPGILVLDGVTYVNASTCNLRYEPLNPAQVLDL